MIAGPGDYRALAALGRLRANLGRYADAILLYAAGKPAFVVDTYTRYRITNPLLFYQTVNTEPAVRARLGAMVNGSLRRVLGNVTLSALLSHQRSAIMRQISLLQ